MESFLPDPEQEAAEILILEGFAEPEELEPEIVELLREASRLAREKGEVHRLLSRYEWIREAMFDEPNG